MVEKNMNLSTILSIIVMYKDTIDESTICIFVHVDIN